MAGRGLGQLGLWLHLRRNSTPSAPADITLPEGNGPLLILCASADSAAAALQVSAQLRKARPDLRLLDLRDAGMPDPATDRAAMDQLITRADPKAILLLGSDLPAALIVAASDRDLPLILGEARLDPRDTGWRLGAGIRRELLDRMQAILVTDAASEAIALRMGAPRERVTMTGPVTEIRAPLHCSEAERVAMAEMLSGRHAWLAACVPPSEEAAVLEAHRAALRQSHLALLFLVPTQAERVETLAAEIEASGLMVARRDQEEEPTDEVQVMISDGPTEMGLWYRLAPVTYMGGTLGGDDPQACHPFEPAALGSAIVHGPVTGRHQTEWLQLDGAGAARQVSNATDLVSTIAELTQPDLIATLAHNAWTVSTGGAGVAMQIAAPVLKALHEARK